ncbi:MAG TPA: trypsin-like peptidase domain-containing protein [Acidimicrobiales bacterium]
MLVGLVGLFAIVAATAVIVRTVDGGRNSAPAASAGSSIGGGALDIQELLRRAQPSVVSIETGKQSSSGVYGSAGSGVIISDDGLVLTNAHVVSSPSGLQVTLYDGRSEPADLVGSLPDTDVALIRLRDPSGVTPAQLGSSAGVRVGDDVVAIGNALNLGGPPSVTKGIVSATERTIEAESVTLRHLIQTDAAINPGNSGGPLLNAAGEVVGINTAIISDAQNIGFSIAIDSLKPLIQDIKDGKGTITPDTAFLGVSTQDLATIPADSLKQFGVQTSDGAFVVDLSPGSAAAGAGLAVGDVITAVDGAPISSSSQVIAAVRAHQAGDEITVTYERNGETRSVTVKLSTRAESGN